MSGRVNNGRFYIVLLEDNPADVYLFQLALTRAELDFELIVFQDGAEAIAYFAEGERPENSTPDLVVLDLNVPKKDGAQVLDAMRQNARFAAVPVVIATSSAAGEERARIQQAGVRLFLTKPHNLTAFLDLGLRLKGLLLEGRGQQEGSAGTV
jgi:CheY-like chemotaxis protein